MGIVLDTNGYLRNRRRHKAHLQVIKANKQIRPLEASKLIASSLIRSTRSSRAYGSETKTNKQKNTSKLEAWEGVGGASPRATLEIWVGGGWKLAARIAC